MSVQEERFRKDCLKCECEKAQEMRWHYDVWFNCKACPFAECYEPTTRDMYLAGATAREIEYKKQEEKERLRALAEEEYKKTKQFRSISSFAATIRKKVEIKALLSKREFAKALRLCRTRDGVRLNFFSAEFLIRYQLSALGYSAAAEEILAYMEW